MLWDQTITIVLQFIEYQLKRNILNEQWRTIEREFLSKISIKHNDELIKLADIKKYKYNYNSVNAAQEIKDKFFLFCDRDISFRDTLFDLYISFKFVFSGDTLPNYTLVNYVKSTMYIKGLYSLEDYKNSDEYNSNLIGRILIV